jgi:hypothetical protein
MRLCMWLKLSLPIVLIIGGCAAYPPPRVDLESAGSASDSAEAEIDIDKDSPQPLADIARAAGHSTAKTATDTADSVVAVQKEPSTAKHSADADISPQPAFEMEVLEDNHSIVIEKALRELCKQIGAKLGSVSEQDCIAQDLTMTDGWSVQGRPIAFKSYTVSGDQTQQLGRVLLIGGIHGDEYSSVSICFRWMEFLDKDRTNAFEWIVVPAANPDGLLQKKSQRQNARGVDLNRNFPSGDWNRLALAQWRARYKENPRRYPGAYAASEPEVIWLLQQIRAFQPDIVIAVHAPYDLLDYDGPPTAPQRVGTLGLDRLGVFPGSLGGYAGLDLGIPVVTIELPHAGIMPSKNDIRRMWLDLIAWVHEQVAGSATDQSTVAG